MLGLTPVLTAYILIVAFVLGLCFGSFFNAYASRLCHGESIVKGRSKCASCGHELSAPDLVPVFSWLFLRGKCRYCGSKVSVRYVLTELTCGLMFLMVVAKFDISGASLEYIIFTSLLFLMALVDLESSIIPDRFILAGLIAYVPLCFLAGGSLKVQLFSGILGAAAASVPVLLIALVCDRILGRDSMGGGDIKLFFLCGLYLGIKCVLPLIILSCVFGILFYFMGKGRVTVSEEENGQGAFPFGPSIALGAFVTLMVGNTFMDWYMGLF